MLEGRRKGRNGGVPGGVPGGVAGVTDDSPESLGALEDRLRDARSNAAPQGLPTIGIRETIVQAVRARLRRRQRIAGALAASVMLAGAAAGIISWQASRHSRTSISAAPAAPAASAPANRSNARAASPSASSGASPYGVPATTARPGCGEIVVGTSVNDGCYGIFTKTSENLQGGANFSVAQPPVPSAGSTSAGSAGAGSAGAGSGGAGSGGAGSGATRLSAEGKLSQRNGYLVVPVGRPVTVIIPGTSGQIWSAPAVSPGQGTDATRVRTLAVNAHGVVAGSGSSGGAGASAGAGSSATFESSEPVTVLVDASALTTCGADHTPCGTPTESWYLFIEFRSG